MDKIYDGNRAKEILDNEVFNQVFDDIEKELFEAWKTSPARDEVGRANLHNYQLMLNKLKAHLTTTFETGKLAELELRHQQNLMERAKDFLTWG